MARINNSSSSPSRAAPSQGPSADAPGLRQRAAQVASEHALTTHLLSRAAALGQATQRGDYEQMKTHLSNGADPNRLSRTSAQGSAMHMAGRNADPQALSLLLARGGNPNLPNPLDANRTPLHYVAATGSLGLQAMEVLHGDQRTRATPDANNVAPQDLTAAEAQRTSIDPMQENPREMHALALEIAGRQDAGRSGLDQRRPGDPLPRRSADPEQPAPGYGANQARAGRPPSYASDNGGAPPNERLPAFGENVVMPHANQPHPEHPEWGPPPSFDERFDGGMADGRMHGANADHPVEQEPREPSIYSPVSDHSDEADWMAR